MNFSSGVDVDIVAGLVAIVLLIAWFTRLEAMSKSNTRDIELDRIRLDKFEAKVWECIRDIQDKHAALDTRVMDKLSNIERLVAKIEGKLE